MTKYIFRLDDACPSMNHEKWNRILSIFDKYNISPIIAVIPNNQDKLNNVSAIDNNFWKKVVLWDKKGYEIAMHGYNHVYTSENSGILGTNRFSEFAGLPLNLQVDKIKKSHKVFKDLGLEIKIWVAPGHSFDYNTIKALDKYTDVKIISDGFSIYPYKYKNFLWLPQQLWEPVKKNKGVWTICYHPNTMNDKSFENLESFILNNITECRSNIEDLFNIFKERELSLLDGSYKFKYLLKRNLKKIIKKFIF